MACTGAPIVLTGAEEGQLQVVAELIEVLYRSAGGRSHREESAPYD